jgi:hypothetical protein
MAKPKWVMKPVRMIKTDFGFRYEGEGVIYDYEKSGGLSDTRVLYFVVARNRRTGKDFIMTDMKYMNMQSIRRNVEVYNDFSPLFKESVFRILFEKGSSIETMKMVSEIISKMKL